MSEFIEIEGEVKMADCGARFGRAVAPAIGSRVAPIRLQSCPIPHRSADRGDCVLPTYLPRGKCMKGDGRDPRPMLAIFAALVIAALWRAIRASASTTCSPPRHPSRPSLSAPWLSPPSSASWRSTATPSPSTASPPSWRAYAELFRLADADGEPLWRSRYPLFPPVHCILTGGSRAVLERRRSTTIALLRSDPRLARRGLDLRLPARGSAGRGSGRRDLPRRSRSGEAGGLVG